MSNPTNLFYTKQHLWINKEEGSVGITDYAQDSMGDILFADLPEEGATFAKGDTFAELESSKTNVELVLPFDGEVKEVNETLDDEPEAINENAFGAWIAKFEITGDLVDVMSATEYDAYLETL